MSSENLLNILLNVASLSLLLIFLAIYLMRKSYSTRTHRIFLVLLLMNTVSAVADILVCLIGEQQGSMVLLYAAGGLHLWTRFIVAVLVLFYGVSYIRDGKVSLLERMALVSFTVLFSAGVFSTVFTKKIWYCTSDRMLVRGEYFYVMILLEIFAVSCVCGLFIINHEKLNLYQMVGFLSNAVIITAGYMVQLAAYGVHIENFAMSLTFLIVCILLENPSDYMYKNSYCYNEKAFMEELQKRIDHKGSFELVVFSVENLNYFKEYVGSKSRSDITQATLNHLHVMYPQNASYYLGEHRFAVFVNSKVDRMEGIITDTEHYFEHEFRLPGMDIALTPYFVTLRYPDFEGTPEDIFECITYPFSAREEFSGRHVIMATKSLLDHKFREEKILHAIRKALKSNSFEVYYQPIYEGGKKRFATAEALLRLTDSELGRIGPDEFIPVAEKHGLIVEIGEYVFEKVCQFWNENALENKGIEFIEVNLSMVQCIQDNLSSRLRTIMASHDINPKYINLEITETAASLNEVTMQKNMSSLVEAGVGFSLDDYGTGFSTANRLVELPVDIVKVDKSILWNAMKNEEALAILRNTIQMLKDLKKQCVVEGVETSEMAVVLRDLGCDFYQGYLFSKPIPGDDFIRFLSHNDFAGNDKAFQVA